MSDAPTSLGSVRQSPGLDSQPPPAHALDIGMVPIAAPNWLPRKVSSTAHDPNLTKARLNRPPGIAILPHGHDDRHRQISPAGSPNLAHRHVKSPLNPNHAAPSPAAANESPSATSVPHRMLPARSISTTRAAPANASCASMQDPLEEEAHGWTDRLIERVISARVTPANPRYLGTISQYHALNLLFAFCVSCANIAGTITLLARFYESGAVEWWGKSDWESVFHVVVGIALNAAIIKDASRLTIFLALLFTSRRRGFSTPSQQEVGGGGSEKKEWWIRWSLAYCTHSIFMLPGVLLSSSLRNVVPGSALLISSPTIVVFDLLLTDLPQGIEAVIRVYNDRLYAPYYLVALANLVSILYHMSRVSWAMLLLINEYGQQRQRIQARRMAVRRWRADLQISVAVLGSNHARSAFLAGISETQKKRWLGAASLAADGDMAFSTSENNILALGALAAPGAAGAAAAIGAGTETAAAALVASASRGKRGRGMTILATSLGLARSKGHSSGSVFSCAPSSASTEHMGTPPRPAATAAVATTAAATTAAVAAPDHDPRAPLLEKGPGAVCSSSPSLSLPLQPHPVAFNNVAHMPTAVKATLSRAELPTSASIPLSSSSAPPWTQFLAAQHPATVSTFLQVYALASFRFAYQLAHAQASAMPASDPAVSEFVRMVTQHARWLKVIESKTVWALDTRVGSVTGDAVRTAMLQIAETKLVSQSLTHLVEVIQSKRERAQYMARFSRLLDGIIGKLKTGVAQRINADVMLALLPMNPTVMLRFDYFSFIWY
ncbi:hypothetical protein BC828DRAFT_110864 [Blastocladiella britannica]|nr:hypothetical protein BC828DRAFT_110864 [Blastocladiella britannica]